MVELDQLADLVPVDTYIPLFLSVILFNYYSKYRIKDYAIFGGIFLCAFITGLATNVAIQQPDALIFYQLSFAFATLTYYLFSLHIRGIQNRSYLSPVSVFETGYVAAILLLISQWELMEQTEEAMFFGITLPRGSSSFFPNGAGMQLADGTILLSTAHGLLAYAYWATIGVWGAFTYATLKLELVNQITKKVRLLWTIGFGLSAIWAVTLLPYLYISEAMNILIGLSYLVKFFIAVRYREALLLSHEQLTRSMEYYENGVSFFETEKQQEGRIEQLASSEERLLENFAKLPEAVITDLLRRQADKPKAVILLGQNQYITSVVFDQEMQETQLIGNLISALLSFSDSTLSPGGRTSSFRFQTDSSKIVISPLGNLLLCYLYTGNSTSAEIRVKRFVLEQEGESLWKEIWNGETGQLRSFDEEHVQSILERFDYDLAGREEFV